MGITINKKTARLSFVEWLLFHRIDPSECQGFCGDHPGECCYETHKRQLTKEYQTQMHEDDVRLGLSQ